LTCLHSTASDLIVQKCDGDRILFGQLMAKAVALIAPTIAQDAENARILLFTIADMCERARRARRSAIANALGALSTLVADAPPGIVEPVLSITYHVLAHRDGGVALEFCAVATRCG